MSPLRRPFWIVSDRKKKCKTHQNRNKTQEKNDNQKKEMNESAIKNVLSRDHKKTKRRKKTRKRRSKVPVGTRRIEAFSNRVGVREESGGCTFKQQTVRGRLKTSR